MRLAQIARKVGLTPIDVKRFLESEFDLTIGNEPNYKLDDNQISAVLEKFPIPVVKVETPKIKETPIEDATENDDVDDDVQELEQVVEAVNEIEIPEVVEEEVLTKETEEPVIEETDAPQVAESKEDVAAVEINYDEPAEEQDSEAGFVEVAVDREAELIKAPKVKLDGLKVLGKIELPEKKVVEAPVKTEEEIEREEADALAELDAAMQLSAQDIKPAKVSRKESKETKAHISSEESYSEYKDEQGIYHFSLQQKLNREKALVRIELDRKRESEKAKKKRHYEEVMKERKQKEPATISKAKQKKIEVKKQKREEKNVEPPKGLWAKFMRWLND